MNTLTTPIDLTILSDLPSFITYNLNKDSSLTFMVQTDDSSVAGEYLIAVVQNYTNIGYVFNAFKINISDIIVVEPTVIVNLPPVFVY